MCSSDLRNKHVMRRPRRIDQSIVHCLCDCSSQGLSIHAVLLIWNIFVKYRPTRHMSLVKKGTAVSKRTKGSMEVNQTSGFYEGRCKGAIRLHWHQALKPRKHNAFSAQSCALQDGERFCSSLWAQLISEAYFKRPPRSRGNPVSD